MKTRNYQCNFTENLEERCLSVHYFRLNARIYFNVGTFIINILNIEYILKMFDIVFISIIKIRVKHCF